MGGRHPGRLRPGHARRRRRPGVRVRHAGHRGRVRTPHEFVARFCADTATPTVGFMSLDLSDPDVLDQLADGVANDLRGIKLYPVLAGFDPRGPAHDPFFAEATRLGLVVLWHMGATPSPVGDLSLSNPLLVDDVARRHPGLVQIIAHLGHPWQRESIVTCRKNRRVFTDVSASWARPLDGYLALVRAQEWDIADKLLFGSDYPMWTPKEAADGLRALAATNTGLPRVHESTLDRILHGDPLGDLGLA
ncbi:amidohydrolase family protein [Actinophytocola sp.]|uniref:amidohydrolase family protein n=1 Tax=Actinophytocola sp. TaxID=1872138 RepID=UPI0025C35C50|nr:amidohydrolase family protein [Actinophytocola sp.]